ncbi:probable proline iminopeptidase [Liolophura sinensis]|uniref:probable proline iminopeptidase n=1 Tax=Liolophura sinensis TaxID=3198878 RepID=UPI003158D33C
MMAVYWKENTTWHLVADVERLRTHLGIEKWVVFGGSWGSALGLAYSESHPDRVKGIIIRGIYTISRRENMWIKQAGANTVFPDYWEDYVSVIPEGERGDLLSAYHRRMTGDDAEEKLLCIRAWNRWEDILSQLVADEEEIEARRQKSDVADLEHAVTACHYFIHGGWLRSDTQLLDDVVKIRHLPGIIIQGRYDIICPMRTAWALHKRWPEADFHIVPDGGHTSREPGVGQKLLEAAEKFKTL